MIGAVVEERSELVLRIAAEGHELGNHSWSHPWLARDCDDEQVREELRRTNAVLAELLGAPPARFRAPRYDVDARVLALARELRLIHTHGDVTPPDWDERSTAGFVATYVLGAARPGSVVGLHDGVPPTTSSHPSRQATVDAVATILPRLRARGLECVTASTLLGRGD